MNVIAAKEAAALLGVGTRRIWQLVDDGALKSVSDAPVLLDRFDVERLAHLQSRLPGRPLASSRAWKEIADFRLRAFEDEVALDVWRRRVRTRASWRRFHVHRSLFSDVVNSPLLVASGLRSAAFHGLPVEADEERFIGYVAAVDLPHVPDGVPVASGNGWNVELGVVQNNCWRFGRAARFADAVTTWLDLEDHQERSARLMLEVVLGSRD